MKSKTRDALLRKLKWSPLSHCLDVMTSGRHNQECRRVVRLFACWCVFQVWPLLTDAGRRSVEVAELRALGFASYDELKAAHLEAVCSVVDYKRCETANSYAKWYAMDAAALVSCYVTDNLVSGAAEAVAWSIAYATSSDQLTATFCHYRRNKCFLVREAQAEKLRQMLLEER